jgi:TonB family protein
MLVVPNSVSVELSGFSAGQIKGIAELRQPAKGSDVKSMTEKFFSDSLSADSRREEAEKEYFLPPKPSYDVVKKANRESMEKLLEQAGADLAQESSSRSGSKSQDSLLTEDDLKQGESMGTPVAKGRQGKTGSPSGSSSGGQADVNSGLDLGNLGRGILFRPAPPEYPEWAKRNMIQGKVVLKLVFDKEGFVVGVTVLQSSGNTQLDIKAKNYFQQIRIEPGQEEFQETTCYMDFKL